MSTTSSLTPTERVRQLFDAIDTLNPQAPLEHIGDDIVFRFGNNELVIGKPAFEESGIQFFGSLASIHHELLSVWAPDADVVITEMNVTYGKHDGSTLTLPCCNVFRFKDGLITAYTIYMDIGPVFAE